MDIKTRPFDSDDPAPPGCRVLLYFAELRKGLEAFRRSELLAISKMFCAQRQEGFCASTSRNLFPQPHSKLLRGKERWGTKVGISFMDRRCEEENSVLSYANVISLAHASEIASRSILLHGLFEHLADASCFDELLNLLRGLRGTLMKIGMGPETRFRVDITTPKATLSMQEKKLIYDYLAPVFPTTGRIALIRPEFIFCLFIDFHEKAPRVTAYEHPHSLFSKHSSIRRLIFTKFIASGLRRTVLARYALNRRPYIGTTSMPPELCFLMANLAKVTRGSLVYDNFCGTGSLLIACGHFGASCIGSDRDARVMRRPVELWTSPTTPSEETFSTFTSSSRESDSSRAVEERSLVGNPRKERKKNGKDGEQSIYGNFNFYGLSKRCGVDLLRLDAASSEKVWRAERGHKSSGLFDVILVDPPYGIREGIKRLDPLRCARMRDRLLDDSSANGTPRPVSVQAGQDSVPTEKASRDPERRSLSSLPLALPTMTYTQEELECDLIDFAARYLVVGGRLLFWHPVQSLIDASNDYLPAHPQLFCVTTHTLRLNRRVSRRLIVLEKTKDNNLSKEKFVKVSRRPRAISSISVRDHYFGKRSEPLRFGSNLLDPRSNRLIRTFASIRDEQF